MTRWTITLFFTAVLASTVARGQTEKVDTTYIYYQDSLKYVDSIVSGEKVYRTVYYLNGQKKMEGAYKTVLVYRKPQKITKDYLKGSARRYYKHKHFFRDNFETGQWTYYYPNGKISGIDKVRRGKVIRQSKWDESGQILFENKRIKRKDRSRPNNRVIKPTF